MNTRTITAQPASDVASRSGFLAQLSDPKRAIASPRMDAALVWGGPIVVLAALCAYLWSTALLLPGQATELSTYPFFFAMLVTYGHLMAVFPRAYLNRTVFEANRFRLTVVPVALLGVMFISPTAFIIAGIVAFFWDVHHSAMQTFGLSRIYEFKAGNGATDYLRRTDLALNWLLYVGPILVGASFLVHAGELGKFADTPLTYLSTLPGYLEGGQHTVRNVALGLWAAAIVWAVTAYRRAMERGYKLSAHKVALMASTGLVTFIAWGFLPPLIAFATINIHHALQYYVIVWMQEGQRIAAFSRLGKRAALAAFVLLTAVLALGYDFAMKMDSYLWAVPFLACSLLHFWFDGFVWSVRKKTV